MLVGYITVHHKTSETERDIPGSIEYVQNLINTGWVSDNYD